MRIYFVGILASLFFSSVALSGGEGPDPSPAPSPAPVVCPDGCKPILKPKTIPKPKPKPKPKPAPAPIPAPTKECKDKVVERIVEKTKYVDREVPMFKKHSVYFLLGRGEGGLVTDHYETRERQGEFAVRRGNVGMVGGLMYGYNFTETWSAGAGVFSTLPTTTVMGMLGVHF